jgi:DNA-directed RNA polymerase specialized sigma24 family protein
MHEVVMNATAAPAESASLASDAELAHRAAEGDRPSFQELYARHAMATWQFAQAVASSGEDAAKATTEGFVRVLRIVRRGRLAAADHFRPYVMAATYRTAIEQAEANGQAVSEEVRPALGSPASPELPTDQLLLESFYGLPERWRAALWLTEAAGLSVEQAAPILGVTPAVASQLAARGHAGLRNRFAQVHRADELPILGPSLRAAALAVPVGLGGRVDGRWRKAMAAERWRSAGPAGWLAERAPRPLAACAIGLLAIGLIGLGVVGERSGPNAFNTSPLAVPAAVGNHETITLSGSDKPAGPGSNGQPAGAGASSGTRSNAAGGSIALGAVDRSRATGGSSGASGSGGAPAGGSSGSSSGGGSTPPTTNSPATTPPTTSPPGTTPPTTAPPTTPPSTPPPTTKPPAQLVAASLNLGSGISTAVSLGSCTGLTIGSLSLGCTTPTSGPGVGLTLLGIPLVTPPSTTPTTSTTGSTPVTG